MLRWDIILKDGAGPNVIATDRGRQKGQSQGRRYDEGSRSQEWNNVRKIQPSIATAGFEDEQRLQAEDCGKLQKAGKGKKPIFH